MNRLKEVKKKRYQLQIINGILAFILCLVILQLWLLMASMNALLGGDTSIVWPTFFASLVCFLLALGLLYYLERDKR